MYDDPEEGSARNDETARSALRLIVGGMAVTLGALVVAAVTGYWHLPLMLVVAGGAATAFIGINRAPDHQRP